MTDVASFRSVCFTAARMLSGRVHGVKSSSSSIVSNYATCIVELPEGTIAILLNAHHPIVGFAEPPREGDKQLRFVDAPKLAEVFREVGGYEVFEPLQLNRPVTSEDTSRLGAAELKELRYWRPSRLGDLIFNSWD